MKKVLITGSKGFVGQHLRREMEENGFDVFGTDLSDTQENSQYYQCDITKQEELDNVIQTIKPDAIVHLAGWSNPSSSFSNPQKTFELNVIGTINLLEAVKKIKDIHPRILLVGSSLEFGNVSLDNLPITEDTALNPNSPYGVSKVASWLICRQNVTHHKMDIVYATPFNHTGPGQLPGCIAPDIASQIVEVERGKTEPIIFTGDLSPKRDILDVRDVVRAYRLLLEKGVSGERYLICSGKSAPVKDVVDKLISMSKKKIEIKTDIDRLRPSEITNIWGDPKKIFNTTGWKTKIPLDVTLKDLLDWYREKR